MSQSQDSQPPDWEVLRAQVRDNARDVDAWLKLVDVAEDGKDFEKINQTYEALLEAFPNTVSTEGHSKL